MNALIYYLFVKPISLLPFFWIYLISDFLYLVLYQLLGYRVKVVATNLANSFPQKSKQERKAIERAFYHHFCDLLMESIKNFSITKKQLEQRCKIVNPDFLERFAAQGKHLILTAGHYNNWELVALGMEFQMPYHTLAIYKPLKNPFWEKKVFQSRSKYGMELVGMRQARERFEEGNQELTISLIATDQAPSNPYNSYWLTFLHQETPVPFGAEKYAVDFDHVVVFGKITKPRRGHYHLEFLEVESNPRSTSYGSITEKHVQLLEDIIKEAPEYWLWTHKRWKRKKPEDFEQVRQQRLQTDQ